MVGSPRVLIRHAHVPNGIGLGNRPWSRRPRPTPGGASARELPGSASASATTGRGQATCLPLGGRDQAGRQGLAVIGQLLVGRLPVGEGDPVAVVSICAIRWRRSSKYGWSQPAPARDFRWLSSLMRLARTGSEDSRAWRQEPVGRTAMPSVAALEPGWECRELDRWPLLTLQRSQDPAPAERHDPPGRILIGPRHKARNHRCW